ncbi:MAG: Ig-like domain-containing protein, partial [Methanobrevibacter sp.]
MNKQLLLTLLVVLSVLFSVSAVCASEVSVTDSYATSLVDDTSDVSVYSYAASSDISVSSDSNVDNDSSKVSLSSEEVLESENSNTLSTNTDSSELTAGAVSTKLITPDRTINIKDAIEGYDYQVILKDANGDPLPGKVVSFDFNGKTSTGITNSKGWATAKLTSDTSGTYDVKVTFKGDADYNKVSQVGSVKIIKNEVNFVAPDRTLYLDDISAGYIYPVILRDSEGNALSKKQVILTFDGKKLTETTNNRGYCYFNLSVNKEGSYGVSLRFDGDQYYYGKSCSYFKTVEVIVMKNVTFVAPDRTLYLDDISGGYSYPVLLRDSDGKALANKKVTITFNGKKLTGTTNNRGYCYFNLSVNKPGAYGVSLAFAGDKYCYSKSCSNFKTVEVIVMKNVTFIAPDRTLHVDDISGGYSYPVLLRDSDGKALANKKVTITFNGKKLTGITNSKGYCYFNIKVDKAGSYGVSFEFAGDKYCYPNLISNYRTVKVVKENTKLTWNSGTLFASGSETFEILLTDGNGVALVNKAVKLVINSKTYSVKTDSNGFAAFDLNLNLDSKTYAVSYSFAGDNGYNSCSGSTKISVINRDVSEGYGYYLFGSDMKSVNLNTLASYGTTDLFLNYYAIEKYGKSDVESWIASANKVGIRVHIWMQTFYDGSWINPVSDGVYNKDIFNSRIAEAEEYANLKGVSGIHLDYLRYPGTAYKYSGGTEAISEFTRLVTEAVHKINPGLIVSAALMPETKDTIYYYGQDYSALSSYLDLVLPMVYKGNYKSGTSWISSTTKWYVDNSKGAKVWITLQSYKSDDDTSRLPASELNNDAKTVLNANADGVILFRYGLSNFVNFTNLDDSSEGISVSIDDILTGAVNLKAYYENNKVLPNTVTVAGQAFKTPEFLYLMSQAISQLGSSDTNPISCIYGVGGV